MILCILDTNYFKKQFITYFIVTILCILFGYIYEVFSHEVYSNYMIYAFTVPLVLGQFPSTLFAFGLIKRTPNRISLNLYNAGVATLTIYSLLKGILEIYGTTNSLIIWYLYIGIALMTVGLVLYPIRGYTAKYKYNDEKRNENVRNF